ncbi:MAG: hypothetical protein AB4040_09885 [Synechococcus sp.]
MAERKKMTEAARKFISTGQIEDSSSQASSKKTEVAQVPSSSLRSELLGESQASEATIRFTVDLPRSLHKRLEHLSLDSGKPKTELARTILKRALDEIGY